MGLIKYKGISYGGGSSVEANPTGSATEDMTKVDIDGTVYGIKDAGAVRTSQVGVASGVAGLDSNGKVPSAQLPSYVDDVVEGYYDSNTDRFYEESAFTTVIPPTDGKSWVDVLTNKSYRWTGSVYVRVDEGVQLGTTHSTAAYGDDAVSTAEPTFTEASTRANLLGTGEKLLVILGKIKKYFSDLKDLAFIAKDGTSSTKYLRGDGTWQAFPTIGNGTLTVKQNGTSKGTFTANQSTAATVELTDTTYSDATTSASGLMSSTDKTKLNNIATGAEVNVQSDWNVTDSGSDAFIKNKPTIPAAQVNSDWNASSGVAQILNKPTIPAAQIQSDWNQTTTTAKDYIKNKPTIPSVATKYDSSDAAETTLADDDKIPFYDTSASGRRNSTWANIKAKLKAYFDGIYSTFSGAYSDLTGKPTLGTAAAKNVPSSGDASSSQVVMGNDTRLTDARNAADVYSWAKASTKPSYTASEVGAIPLNGSENITGDLMPKNDDSITLGATNKRYSSVWSKNLYATEVLRVGTQENNGHVDFWNTSGYSVVMLPTALTANRSLYMPNASGTIATQEWVNSPTSFANISRVNTSQITDFAHNSFTAAGVLHIRGYFHVATALADQTNLFKIGDSKKAKFRSEGIIVKKNTGEFVAPIYISANSDTIILNTAIGAITASWCFVIMDIAIQ